MAAEISPEIPFWEYDPRADRFSLPQDAAGVVASEFPRDAAEFVARALDAAVALDALARWTGEGAARQAAADVRTENGWVRLIGSRMPSGMASGVAVPKGLAVVGPLIEEMPIGVVRMDDRLDRIVLNEAARALLRFDSSEVSSDRWTERVHPEDRERGREKWMAAFEAGTEYLDTYRVILPEGDVRWVESRARRTGQFGWIGTIQDVTERLATLRALERSESRFRLLNDAIPFLVWLTDGESAITDANERVGEYLGLPPHEVSRLRWVDHVHEEDFPAATANWSRAQADAKPYETHLRLRRHDGEYRWHRLKRAPIQFENGRALTWIGVMQDIHDEREARALGLRLHEIVEATPDIVSYATPDGRVRYVNPAGRHLSEGDGRIRDSHPDWALEIIEKEGIPTAVREGAWRGETAILGRDGVEIPVSQVILAHRDEAGTVVQLSTILRDMTQERAARRELEESRRFVEKVATSSPDTLFVVRPETLEITWSSRDFFEVLGYGVGSGLGIADVVHPDDAPLVLAAMGELLENAADDETREIEHRVRTASGEYLTVMARMVVFQRDADGRGTHLLAVASDVTERVRLAAALAQARDAALAAARAKSAFLANMSHEIRTPLNGVIGLTSLLSRADLPGDLAEVVRTIQGSGETVLRVVNDILDVSKMEAGMMEIEEAPANLSVLCADVVALHAEHARERGLALTLDAPPEPSLVWADAVRFKQVVGNLVGNAIKFTSRGGVTVRLRESVQGLGPEALVAVTLAVEDTGIGIPPDRQATIFERFEQAEAGTARRFGGTGLGLTISRALAEFMGGRLDLESTPGVGSVFTLSLFLRPAERAAPPEPLGAPIPRGLRVLLAEDNPVNVVVARRVLSDLGCVLDHAENGLRAISLALAHPYDVILMDVRMPLCDGLAAARAIREHEATRGTRIPIVALTANAMEEDREACRAAGMDGFLAKPFTFSQMEETLSRFVRPVGSEDPEPFSLKG